MQSSIEKDRFGGVRSRLALLVLVCVVPLAVVAAFLVYIPYEREQAQVRQASISRARAMVSAMDREFASTTSALLALSTAPQLASNDLRAFHAQAGRALAHIHADSIVVFDNSGQMLLSTRRAFGEPLPHVGRVPLLERLVATGKPGVSDLYKGALTSELMVAIGVPVKLKGAIRYTLYATIEPGRLSAVLSEQKLPDTWRAAIADSKGSVVARTHEITRFIGTKVSPDVLQRMDSANESVFESETLDGIPVVTAYSRSEDSGWMVILGTPLAELTADIRRTVAWLIASTLVALAVGLGSAWRIGGRIARSVTALVGPARALGSGDPVVVSTTDLRESHEVGVALQEAAATLRQARHDALHDSLTGLANRTAFNLVVDQEVALCERNKAHLAILYIDLDGFKAVNDAHGHSMGDELLRSVALRLRDTVRHSDLVARVGGDEFVVALVDTDVDTAKTFAAKVIETLSAPYRLGDVEAVVSASVGISVYPESGADCDTLIVQADGAMYEAKAQGKHRVCVAA